MNTVVMNTASFGQNIATLDLSVLKYIQENKSLYDLFTIQK